MFKEEWDGLNRRRQHRPDDDITLRADVIFGLRRLSSKLAFIAGEIWTGVQSLENGKHLLQRLNMAFESWKRGDIFEEPEEVRQRVGE